tara:strand:+ start:4660 stop:5529 length:870 start_codon:yes stop_codon:yes gene_type:complete
MGNRNAMLDSSPIMFDPPQNQMQRRMPFSPTGFLLDGATTMIGKPLAGAYNGWRQAMGYDRDPNAAEGYVSAESIGRTGWNMAELAATGALASRPAARAAPFTVEGNHWDHAMANIPDGPIPQKPKPDTPVVTKKGDDFRAISKHGEVDGYTSDGDFAIYASGVKPFSQGQGHGSALYRSMAEEFDAPFQSDASVSRQAQVMYDRMFPKHGYNVIENPAARINSNGTKFVPDNPDALYGSQLDHVYRVEPPGQHTERTFYANNKNAAGAAALDRREQESPNMMFQRGLY